jgi:hypothetical protein
VTAALPELRALLTAALDRLDAIEAEAYRTASERRAAALRAAVAVVDPAGAMSTWQTACAIERALLAFDRRGDMRAGRRAARTDLEAALLGLHREEIATSARSILRALTTLSDDGG